MTLLPFLLLTLVASLAPALIAPRFQAFWQKHGDIGEVIGTSLLSSSAFFLVALPVLSLNSSMLFWLGLGISIALLMHIFFEQEGEERAPKVWFIAVAFLMHNFPEGVASGDALMKHGLNSFSAILAIHNIFDAIIMALGLMAVGIHGKTLVTVMLIAALGEVMGMLVSSLHIPNLDQFPLVSVGALIGLGLDSMGQWNKKQGLISLATVTSAALLML